MAKNKVEITGIRTSTIKVLKHEEMIELFKSYQSGNKLAKEELVNGNLKLVLSIINKYNLNGKYESMFIHSNDTSVGGFRSYFTVVETIPQ